MPVRGRYIAAGLVVAIIVIVSIALIFKASNANPQNQGSTISTFASPPRATDYSEEITNRLATLRPPTDVIPEIKLPPPPPSTGLEPPASLLKPTLAVGQDAGGFTNAELEAATKAALNQAQSDAKAAVASVADANVQPPRDDLVAAHLARYGTPVTKQLLPVGGLTLWTVISKNGKPVKLYTTADGKALFSGVIWNLETGQNVTDAIMVPPSGSDPNFADQLPKVVAPAIPKSNLVSGPNALPAAFDGKTPTQIPEAIRLVDQLAGYKEGNGGPGDTLYVIIDPRCPYCRRAYLNAREHVKNGATIKWIPTAALGRPEQGLPLAATILRYNDPDVLARVLGKHEPIITPPTDFELKQLNNSLEFMFEAFKQNNEPNPGVPVAFFIDRRSGKARMVMGVSEEVVLDDIFGKHKK